MAVDCQASDDPIRSTSRGQRFTVRTANHSIYTKLK